MQDGFSLPSRTGSASECARQILEDLDSHAPGTLANLPEDFLCRLAEVLTVSPPLLNSLRSHPSWIEWLCRKVQSRHNAGIDSTPFEEAWIQWVASAGPGPGTLNDLRSFKRREYLALAYYDISGMAAFDETVARLSALADCVLSATLENCWKTLVQEEVRDRPSLPDGFAIFALGKLGGRELNYSSDVDLIFCRRSEERVGDLRFYTRLGERIIQALSHAGPDEFLYRVDMRLRPHGETGPLVPTLSSLINYYESWGEAWERQALIKARFVAGTPELGRRFENFVEQFTFARQMDDSSLEEIKRIKHRSEKQYAQRHERINVKQGPGGIRDIEFYLQYLQLIAGWAHPTARAASSLEAIRGLEEAKMLLEGEGTSLALAYLFLRTVEHRLQLRSLTPQVLLPNNPAELAVLARSLGFVGGGELAVTAFQGVFRNYSLKVRNILERIYLTPGYLQLTEREEEFARLLSDRTPKERAREMISQFGFRDPDKAWQNIRLMGLGPAGHHLPPGERRQFLEFFFPLMEVLKDSIDPDVALHHLESFAAASGNRISFLRALAARRPHLARLSNLLALSNLAHQVLSRHPEYFDSLARGIHLHEGRSAENMQQEIRNRLGASPRAEPPGVALRKFQQREMIRIAYRDLAGLADALEISEELSNLGQACVLIATELSRPPITDFGRDYEDPLCVIALGKLGSRQMHYGSDLDLMFLYRVPPEGAAAGDRARAQQEHDDRIERIVAFLSEVTTEGAAYDLDLRLRPEGASGLLARSWEGLQAYTGQYMEPWERMAMIRSRVLGAKLDQAESWGGYLAETVYGHPWSGEDLESLRHLKRRIETEKNKESRICVDFKYGRGGIVDLEFLVQFLQILHGRDHPSVRSPSVAGAVPPLWAAGALSASERDDLLQAHAFQRRLENHYQLMEEWNSREISREAPALERLARSLGFAGKKKMLSDWDETCRLVRSLVERIIFA